MGLIKKARIASDENNKGISAPVLKSVVASGSSYTPETDETVILGADATITLDGEAIDLLQGSTFILLGGITYAFTATTQLGIS